MSPFKCIEKPLNINESGEKQIQYDRKNKEGSPVRMMLIEKFKTFYEEPSAKKPRILNKTVAEENVVQERSSRPILKKADSETKIIKPISVPHQRKASDANRLPVPETRNIRPPIKKWATMSNPQPLASYTTLQPNTKLEAKYAHDNPMQEYFPKEEIADGQKTPLSECSKCSGSRAKGMMYICPGCENKEMSNEKAMRTKEEKEKEIILERTMRKALDAKRNQEIEKRMLEQEKMKKEFQKEIEELYEAKRKLAEQK